MSPASYDNVLLRKNISGSVAHEFTYQKVVTLYRTVTRTHDFHWFWWFFMKTWYFQEILEVCPRVIGKKLFLLKISSRKYFSSITHYHNLPETKNYNISFILSIWKKSQKKVVNFQIRAEVTILNKNTIKIDQNHTKSMDFKWFSRKPTILSLS